ncbi:sphingomyelinase C-like [Ptychodera flava]|uniref:sphingomyelinase C-like n=1 Tax=Ptychodera flava TaxID=63121 RepID=UPI00396A98A9
MSSDLVMCCVVALVSAVSLGLTVSGTDTCQQQPNATRPSVWIDDVPGCRADASHCPLYGMEYVCSAPISNNTNATCQTGVKVLCQLRPAVLLTEPKRAKILTILAYNIFEVRYTFLQRGQRERTCRIPFHLFNASSDVDVIVFNEVFMGGCFPGELSLRDLLRFHGYMHVTSTVGVDSCQLKQVPKVENGGVLIASRWPILAEDEHIYQAVDNTTTDLTWCKGVMYAKINKTTEDGETQIYHVFGTHMQAFTGDSNDRVRVAQAGEMKDFMKTQSITVSEPVIYAGDFNADRLNNTKNSEDVLAALDATMPTVVGDYAWTYDRIGNDLKLLNDSYRSWLDYVTYSNGHLLPDASNSSVRVLRLRDDPFDVCMESVRRQYVYPNSDDCRDTWTVADLSDHYAVLGVLDFHFHDEGVGTTQSTSPVASSSPYINMPLCLLYLGLIFLIV